MNEILDIRFHGKLTSDISLQFNKIAHEKRSDFNDFIAIISRPNIENIDWWVEGPASRNTYSSSLFHNYCVIHLLNHLITDKFFFYDKVLVDSSHVASVIECLLKRLDIKNCKVIIENSFKGNLKKYLKRNFLIFFLLFRKCFQMVMARFFTPSKIHNNQLILIDTFLMPGYIDSDRWYGTLWENLSKKKKLEAFFVPTLVLTKFKDIISIYKNANSSNRNYIFKENFLNLNDIIFAFRHKKRLKKIKFDDINVLKCDFSNLIEDELNNNADINAVLESILTYRFIRNFKLKGYKVNIAIDWFEGQSLDKAWNMGFKFFYPKTKTIGYRPNESFPFYMSSFPTLIEKQAKVIPDFFAIQGKSTEITLKEFMPDMKIILIPSFKSQYVWNFKRTKVNHNNKIILIPLPISIKSSRVIIERLVEVFKLNSFESSQIILLFKPHPAQSLKKLKADLVDFPNYISFTLEKSFIKLLTSASVLITEASSTCLEAMACGVPVIMMENQEGLTYDSIPSSISDEIYRKVRTENQLIQAIDYFIFLDIEATGKLELIGKEVRKNYFEPISQRGINRLMKIDTLKKRK